VRGVLYPCCTCDVHLSFSLFYCLNKNQTKKVKRGKWADKLKKKKTKFKILSSPLTLSLSKFTDSLSLSFSFSPALPLPGRSAVLHRIPSLSLSGTPSSRPVGRPSPDSVSTGRPSFFIGFRLSLSGTPSSRPVGHPSSPDSVSTGRHLSLSRPYFTGEKHSLSSPQPTIPLHRQGPFSTGKVAFPFFFFNRSTTFFLFLFFFPFSVFLTEVTTFFFLFFFSVFLTEGTTFFFLFFFCFFNRRHDLLLPLFFFYFFFCFFNRRHDLLPPFFLKKKIKKWLWLNL
jgi:hypothetical protein